MPAHSALTGAELHEPKGVATATDGFVARAASGAVSWGTVGNSNVIAGMPVQMSCTTTTAITSGSTALPIDNSIPQITEGAEYMTHAHTPLSATNKLLIQVHFNCCNAGSGDLSIGMALFQDATAAALAAVAQHSTQSAPHFLTLTYLMTAGTTSEITFRVRAGNDGGSEVQMNSETVSARVFGGVATSSITVTEFKAS